MFSCVSSLMALINISESGWKQDFAGTLRGNAVITLPGNTSAIVRIPKKYNVTVGNLPGVRRVSATEGYMEVEIGSGSYHFGK